MKVVQTFLQAGVPLSKLGIFRELLEENGFRLSDRRFMFDVVPFILKEEEACLKQELQGKQVGVIFDGHNSVGKSDGYNSAVCGSVLDINDLFESSCFPRA